MLDPENLIISENKYSENVDVIHFDSEIPEMDEEEYNIYNPKEMKRYIEDIKKLVRQSRPYKKMVEHCRKYMNMNKCSFYENINNIDTTKIKIHLHHTPFGLHDICKIVINKRLFYKESMRVEDVAEEVTLLHYTGMVGLIPLSETVHELVHNSYLFVPCSMVFGNYKLFVELYNTFFDEDHNEVYERILEYSNTYDYANNAKILNRNYIHIDLSGAYKLPVLKDISDLVSNRIIAIKQGLNNSFAEQVIQSQATNNN